MSGRARIRQCCKAMAGIGMELWCPWPDASTWRWRQPLVPLLQAALPNLGLQLWWEMPQNQEGLTRSKECSSFHQPLQAVSPKVIKCHCSTKCFSHVLCPLVFPLREEIRTFAILTIIRFRLFMQVTVTNCCPQLSDAILLHQSSVGDRGIRPIHSWAPANYQALRQACNLRQGEVGVGGWTILLLPSADLKVVLELSTKIRHPPYSQSPTIFLLQAGSQDMVLGYCHPSPASNHLPENSASFILLFCPVCVPPFSRLRLTEHVCRSYSVLGSAETSASKQLDNLYRIKGEKTVQTVICTRPYASSAWKGTDLLIFNWQHCLLVTGVLILLQSKTNKV